MGDYASSSSTRRDCPVGCDSCEVVLGPANACNQFFENIRTNDVQQSGGKTPYGPELKWLDHNYGDLVMDFFNPVTVVSYDWMTANDEPNRDPTKWTLEGSNDGNTWNVVHDVYALSAFAPTEDRHTWQGPFFIPCATGFGGNVCQNGGTITGFTGSCGCSCADGYDGENCELAACTAGFGGNACENGGTISGFAEDEGEEDEGSCGCDCAGGYSGDNCELAACTTGFGGNACQNGALFSGFTGGCSCKCTDGYGGDNCELAVCPTGFGGNACQNGGAISAFAGTCGVSGCSCVGGYSGDNCELADPCTTGFGGNACQNGGAITGVTGSCGCSCVDGSGGDNCECTSGLGGLACQNGGVITGSAGRCGCSCVGGHGGDNCECETGVTSRAGSLACATLQHGPEHRRVPGRLAPKWP
jgi:hypothetical protein